MGCCGAHLRFKRNKALEFRTLAAAFAWWTPTAHLHGSMATVGARTTPQHPALRAISQMLLAIILIAIDLRHTSAGGLKAAKTLCAGRAQYRRPWPSTSMRAGGRLAITRSLCRRSSPADCQGDGPRSA